MTPSHTEYDHLFLAMIEAVERLAAGETDVTIPADDDGTLGELGDALHRLAEAQTRRAQAEQQLLAITEQINAGVYLDDVLQMIYRNFRTIIPYNRIGLSLINAEEQTVRAYWADTDRPDIKLEVGYEQPLAESSLLAILETGQPRILNDLEAYLAQKPDSESTRLIVEEGIRSSLTCPLIADGSPVGFIFFSSTEPHTYDDVHIDTFQKIAGLVSGIVEKSRLMSELAEKSALLEERNEVLRELNETKNRFLGIAAHDLRTPIANIQMTSVLMADPQVEMTETERRTFLDLIVKQSDYMLHLLGNLLDVSQIESGRLDLSLETFEMRSFMEEAVQWQSHIAGTKGTTIRLAQVPPGQIEADPVRLRQVFDNLISNAVKYSPPDSLVEVTVGQEAGCWLVRVRDQGPGIKEEDRANLFQYFGRLSSMPTGGEKSTGLGLAITQRAVQAHGGELGVESHDGQGSTFWVRLPVKRN